jgi:hypothetical protein
MKIVPLEAAHLFDLNAAILGWLFAAVQPQKAASAAHYINLNTWLIRCEYSQLPFTYKRQAGLCIAALSVCR